MRRQLFPPEIRTMAIVPRWSIVHTLVRDNLSNHSYFVAMYARSLAQLIGWDGDVGDLLFRALAHDTDETISGDIPGPVKHAIVDSVRAEEYLDLKMRERLSYIVDDLDKFAVRDPQEDEEAWAIVKAADRMDALIFLINERRLGNTIVAAHIGRSLSQLEAAFKVLPGDPAELDRLWSTVMMPVIKDHETTGAMGIV